MERPNSSRISKTQRETHSEIERKRRERMKRDTEFLRRQIANSQCKDKLSIFQAGAERLIQYTDKLGERDYIINDEEYSRIIMSNFAGFSIHIHCSDGKILDVSANAEKILDLTVNQIVGRRIQDLAEPSSSTNLLINEVFQCSDLQWDIFNGLVSRNFILPLRCGPNVSACHSVYGVDGGRYRFIEFCGDLSHQKEASNPEVVTIIFRGLCRPHDPVSSSVQNNQSSIDLINVRSDSVGTKHFSLRLSSDSFRIIEVVGDCEAISGIASESLLRRLFRDVWLPSERNSADRLLCEVQIRSPVIGSLHLIHGTSGEPIRLDIRLSAIRLGSYFHCVVCRLKLPQFESMADADRGDGIGNRLKSNITQPSAVPSTVTTFSQMDPLDPKNTETRCSSNKLHSLNFPVSDNGVKQKPNPAYNIADAATYEIELSEQTSTTNIHQTGSLTNNAYPESVDDWFRHVDTSSFQSLLKTDYLPSTDGY